ncbi:hypothetical protein U1Q18_052438 [Sarracenia purpurea var. burkii]
MANTGNEQEKRKTVQNTLMSHFQYHIYRPHSCCVMPFPVNRRERIKSKHETGAIKIFLKSTFIKISIDPIGQTDSVDTASWVECNSVVYISFGHFNGFFELWKTSTYGKNDKQAQYL